MNDAQTDLLARIDRNARECAGLKFWCGAYNLRGGAAVRCGASLVKAGVAQFIDDDRRWIKRVSDGEQA